MRNKNRGKNPVKNRENKHRKHKYGKWKKHALWTQGTILRTFKCHQEKINLEIQKLKWIWKYKSWNKFENTKVEIKMENKSWDKIGNTKVNVNLKIQKVI